MKGKRMSKRDIKRFAAVLGVLIIFPALVLFPALIFVIALAGFSLLVFMLWEVSGEIFKEKA